MMNNGKPGSSTIISVQIISYKKDNLSLNSKIQSPVKSLQVGNLTISFQSLTE